MQFENTVKFPSFRLVVIALALVAGNACTDQTQKAKKDAESEAVRELERCAGMKAELAGEIAAKEAMRRGDFRIGAKIHVLQESLLAVVPPPSKNSDSISDAHWNRAWVEGRRFPSDSVHRFPLTDLMQLIETSDPWAMRRPEWQKAARSCEVAQIKYVAAYNRTVFAAGAEVLDKNGRPSWQKPWNDEAN